MKDFTILQVGDLHYDDLRNAELDVDVKDRGLSDSIRESLGPHVLQAVMKPMVEQLELSDAVMITGDLSSYGNYAVYVEAVSYLNVAFALPDRSPDTLHAVVGNHDVDRELIGTGERELREILAKFAPLTVAWQDHAVPILAPDAVRATALEDGKVGIELFSLNSCIGCGEYRERVLDAKLERELRKRVRAGDKAARDTLFEQLDSPMFLDEHITEVAATVRSMPATHVPMVLAHHNVLPQFQPRLQIYTEMINSGAVRARLGGCGRAVIYLHGHIHDDPVEVIDQYHPHTGRLIAISAPQVHRGFNVIKITFGQRDLPLGTTVIPWRYRYGEVRPEQAVRISLRRRDQENHEATPEILAVVARHSQLRYSRFLEDYRDLYGDNRTEDDLQQALIEADWAGLVMIDNRDASPGQWVLRMPLL